MVNNSALFIFTSLLNMGQLLKERICSSRSKFFSLRIDPLQQGFATLENKKKDIKLLLFVQKEEKHIGVSKYNLDSACVVHLNIKTITSHTSSFKYTSRVVLC